MNLAVDSCSERVEDAGHLSRQFNPIAPFGSMRLLAGGSLPRPRARKEYVITAPPMQTGCDAACVLEIHPDSLENYSL